MSLNSTHHSLSLLEQTIMEKTKKQIDAVKGLHTGCCEKGEHNDVGSSKIIVGARSARTDQKKGKTAKELEEIEVLKNSTDLPTSPEINDYHSPSPLQKLIPQHKHKSMKVNAVDAKEVLKVAINLNEDDNIAGNESSNTESDEAVESGNSELGRHLQQNKMTQLNGIGSGAAATRNVAAVKAAGSALENVLSRCLNEGISSKHIEIEEEIDNGSDGYLPAIPTDNASPKNGLTDMGSNSSPRKDSNSPASWEAIEEAFKKIRAAADQPFTKQMEVSELGCLEFDRRARNAASRLRWRRIKVILLGKLKSLMKMEPLDRRLGQEKYDKRSRRMRMESNTKGKKKERSQSMGCCSNDDVLDCHTSK